MPCCGLRSRACRNCATKKITETRECWACREAAIGPAQLVNSSELRQACKLFQDTGDLEENFLEKVKNVDEKGKLKELIKKEEKEKECDVEKMMLKELLEKEKAKRKEIEEEEKQAEIKQEAKYLCKDFLREEKIEVSERHTGDIEEVNKHEDEAVGIQESIVAVTKLPESEDVEEKMSEDQAIPVEAKNDKVDSVSSGLKSSSGEPGEHEAVDVSKLENVVALAPLPETEEFVLEDMNIETADDMVDSLDTVSMNMGVSLAKMKERNCEFERCMSPDEKACNELRFGAQLELLLKFTADHARCLMCGKRLASEFLILKHIQLKHKVEYGQLRTVLQITNMNTLNMLVHKAIRAEFSYQQKQIFPIPVV